MGHTSIVKELLSSGAEVDAVREVKNTCIYSPFRKLFSFNWYKWFAVKNCWDCYYYIIQTTHSSWEVEVILLLEAMLFLSWKLIMNSQKLFQSNIEFKYYMYLICFMLKNALSWFYLRNNFLIYRFIVISGLRMSSPTNYINFMDI